METFQIWQDLRRARQDRRFGPITLCVNHGNPFLPLPSPWVATLILIRRRRAGIRPNMPGRPCSSTATPRKRVGFKGSGWIQVILRVPSAICHSHRAVAPGAPGFTTWIEWHRIGEWDCPAPPWAWPILPGRDPEAGRRGLFQTLPIGNPAMNRGYPGIEEE